MSDRKRWEALLTPAEFGALADRDLSGTTCVVLDVLRATTSMVAALAAGAAGIIPCADIPEALAVRARQPDALLAGERDGWRIGAAQTGGVEFDLGNSPREFTPDCVRGRLLAMTTTNGTRALRACASAQRVLVGAYVNLGALVTELARNPPPDLLVVGSGTFEQAAFEDALVAGALIDELSGLYADAETADSVLICRELFRTHAADIGRALGLGRNGSRLLRRAELRDDVALCADRDRYDLVAVLRPDGTVCAV